jgi:hypothetical protein
LIGKNDRLVYYAVGGFKCIFAIVDVVGHPQRNVAHEDPKISRRWPHAVAVSLTPYRVEHLRYAPQLAEVSMRLAQAIGQGVSHLEMSEAESMKAAAALRNARDRERMLERRTTGTEDVLRRLD